MNQKITERTFDFAVKISKYQLSLKEKKYYEIASQLFRSWTSIGANIAEGHRSPSFADFYAKLGISLKEAAETEYWLYLLLLEQSLEDLGFTIN